jgi:dTMP kinase
MSKLEVVTFREPGGSIVGEKIRDILKNDDMAPITELMLFTAARMENVMVNILPALKEGKIVIMDRFLDSTAAYQGYARRIGPAVWDLEKIVKGHVTPDYDIFLDASIEKQLERIEKRGEAKDRIEREGDEFRQRVYEGFHRIHREHLEKGTGYRINSDQSENQVRNDLVDWVEKVLMPGIQYSIDYNT